MSAQFVDVEDCEAAGCEHHATELMLGRSRHNYSVRLILYLVAGGFAFSGSVVLIKPLVPGGNYDQALKAGLYGWINVVEFEMLRKIMYYSVGCSSFIMWCLMFMNRLSLGKRVPGRQRVVLDFIASMVDLAVWVSLLRLVMICSKEKNPHPEVCHSADHNSQALCEVILGELWFRQKMGVICAQMVGLVHFILFVGLFPDTLFESIAVLRGRDQEQQAPPAYWEEQKSARDEKSMPALPAYTRFPSKDVTPVQYFTVVEMDCDQTSTAE